MAVESRLQNEILRRQHCEKQIFELNQHLLELQEQLAVANGLEAKREKFAQNMETSIKKVLKSWHEKEAQLESVIEKLRSEKQKSQADGSRLELVGQALFKFQIPTSSS